MGYWSFEILANDRAGDEASAIVSLLVDRFNAGQDDDAALALLHVLAGLVERDDLLFPESGLDPERLKKLFTRQITQVPRWTAPESTPGEFDAETDAKLVDGSKNIGVNRTKTLVDLRDRIAKISARTAEMYAEPVGNQIAK